MRNPTRRLNAIERTLKHSAQADEGLRRRQMTLRVIADPEALDASLELFGWVLDRETDPNVPWEQTFNAALALPEAGPMLARVAPLLERALA